MAAVVATAVALPAIIISNTNNINSPSEQSIEKPVYSQINKVQQKSIDTINLHQPTIAVKIPQPTPIKVEAVKAEPFAFINNDDDSKTVAKKLSDNGNQFMALATVVENLENKPYYDSGGLNVGMGYCITKRIQENSKDQVQQELLQAGFSEEHVDTLLNGKRKDILKIEISNKQAIILLNETSKQYEQIAKDNIGEDIFNKLPKSEQAVWTYFAWNTGENMGQFKNLIKGIQDGNSAKVLDNVTPSFKNANGEWQQNKRLGIAIQTSLIDGIDAIANGENYDHSYHEKSIANKMNAKYLKHHQIITKVDTQQTTLLAANSETPQMSTSNSLSKLQQLRNQTASLKTTTNHNM